VTFFSNVQSLIFGELPSNWGFERKAKSAAVILGVIERHVGEMTEEANELDQEIDRLSAKVKLAQETILIFGGFEGNHHRAWVLDQALRALAGDSYDALIAQRRKDGYDWDEGIAP